MARGRMAVNESLFRRFGPPQALGVQKEKKVGEFRCILPPKYIKEFKKFTRIEVFVQAGAGKGAGYEDAEFVEVGAHIVDGEKFYGLPLIAGVKETTIEDMELMGKAHIPGQGITRIGYEHLPSDAKRFRAAVEASIEYSLALVALETMHNEQGQHPALYPMSVAAGELSGRVLPLFLLQPFGPGLLPLGINKKGAPVIRAVVLGGGVVGKTAAERLAVNGIQVTLLEILEAKRKALISEFSRKGLKIKVIASTRKNLLKACTGAHILISGIYRSGAKTDQVLPIEALQKMHKGAVATIVDADNGGAIAEPLPETNIYTIADPMHLPVQPRTNVRILSPQNWPSMGSGNSSDALADGIISSLIMIGKYGLIEAARRSMLIRTGINIIEGQICCEALAKTYNTTYTPFDSIIYS